MTSFIIASCRGFVLELTLTMAHVKAGLMDTHSRSVKFWIIMTSRISTGLV